MTENRPHVCPWWVAYTFDNPLRRILHPADRILGPYVKPDMRVLDVGCGFGHFSLGMARLIGPSGRVVAVDLQENMLEKTLARARRKGLAERIDTVLAGSDRLGVTGPFDFALAANVVHEVPDRPALFGELFGVLRPGAGLLVIEPKGGHVSDGGFAAELKAARAAGFIDSDGPEVVWQRTALLRKPG